MYELKRYHFSQISSTNDYAKELLTTEKFVVVSADYQLKGRGRNNKNWVGDFGKNVYCTFGIKHDSHKDIDELIAYQAFGCLLVEKVLRQITKEEIFVIKYPNDIYASCTNEKWRKLSGVLIEHEFTGNECIATLVGIGINVGQQNFESPLQNKATSLVNLGFTTTPNDITECLVQNFRNMQETDYKEIFEAWKQKLNIEGQEVKLLGSNEHWEVLNVQNDGRLSLLNRRTEKKKTINDGDSIDYNLSLVLRPDEHCN